MTGLIDLEGAPAFTAEVHFFEESLGLQAKERAGPGNGPWTTGRPYGPHGRLVVRGLAVCHGFPLPLDWPEKHPTGTIALQHHQGGTSGLTAKQTISVRVDDGKISLAKDLDDGWNIELVCTLLDAPVMSGFGGTQPTTTPAVFTDQELFAGRTKTHDPNNLLEAATRSWDVIPLPTGDAAELARFALLVANADPPFPGAKVKFARLEANRDDEGGTVTAQYNLTDTVEDVVNPATSTTIDQNGLTSSGSSAAINATPAPPGNAELVERETTTQEIHDTATLNRTNYGVRSTIDDAEFPHTHFQPDPKGIEDFTTQSKVYAVGAAPQTPTAPAGLQLHHWFDVPRTSADGSNLWQRVWVWRRKTSQDEVEFAGTSKTIDLLNLEDQRQEAKVQLTTSPTWPTESDLIQHHFSHRQIVPGKFDVAYHWRRMNTEQEREAPHTRQSFDASAIPIANAALSADVWDSTAAAPADPVNPPVDTLKLVDKFDVPLAFDQAGAVTRKLRVYQWGTKTPQEALEFNYEKVIQDANGLASAQVIASVWPTTNVDPGSPETPNPANEPADPGNPIPCRGVQLKRKFIHDLPLTAPGKTAAGAVTYRKYLRVWYYEPNDSKDDVELPGTSARYVTARGGEQTVTSLLDNADPDWSDGSANGIAAAVFARLKNDVTFDWVEVVKETAARARRIVHTTNPIQFLEIKTQGGKWPTNAILSGSTVSVWLAQKRRRGTGLWIASVEPQTLHQFSMTFVLRRRLVDGNIAPGLLKGTTNLNPFLSLAPQTVTYVGTGLEYNLLVASPRVLPFDFVFRYESLGVFDSTGVRCGHFLTDADLSGVNANEWVDAGTFGWPASPLPAYDYGVFLT